MRGMSTAGVTIISSPKNSHFPAIYASGSPERTPLQKLLRGLFRLVTGVHIHPCNELRVGISGALREQTPGFERIFFHAGLLERAAHGEIQLIIGLCQS